MESEGDDGGDLDNHVSDDNLGSCGSVDDAKTPEDDTESLNQSLSSPGCGSVLSSLQSPSASLASPLNLLASPLTPQSIIHNTDHQSMYVDSQSTHQQQKKLNNNNNMNSNSVVPTSSTTTATSTSETMHHHMNQTLERMSPLPRPPSDSTSLFDIKPNIKIEPGSTNSLLGSLPPSSRKLGKIHMPNVGLQQHSLQPQSQHSQHLLPHPEMFFEKLTRNPVGVNPQDINNPLSINQLTKPVYVNHHSPIHPQHHHLINIGSPLSPASTSSNSSLVTSLHQSIPLSSQQQHQNQTMRHNMNFTAPIPVTNSHHHPQHHHHHHHLSHHLQHLAPSLSHGYQISPAATISSTQIPPPQTVSAATGSISGHHRGGDDGCAISVT